MLGKKKNTPDNDKPEVKNWYTDRYQVVVVWRNILAVITLISLGVSLVAVLAVRGLAPLKTVEPFVIQVDDKTGITQVVNPLSDQELMANEAVKNFFVIQYVRSRETYDVGNLEYDYNVVRVMSDPDFVYPQFLQERSQDNADSPTNRLQSYGTRRVKFKSISYINPNVAQVRLQITERLGSNTTVMNKIALVTFEYTNLELTPEERNINPLGFIVTNYRLDEDTLQR